MSIAGNAKAMQEINRLSKEIEDRMDNEHVYTEDGVIIMAFNLKYELVEFKIIKEGVDTKTIEKSIREWYSKVFERIKYNNREIQKDMMEESKKIYKKYT